MNKKNSTNFTIENMGRDWLFFTQNSVKISSAQTYKYLFEKHIENSDLSTIAIGLLTSEDVAAFSRGLVREGLSPKTVNSILLTVNAIFKYAKNLYGITPPYIKYVRDERRETRVLTVAEQNRLESYLRADLGGFNMGVLFALYTGVRIGELCALKWSDIADGAVSINKTMYRLRSGDGKTAVMIDKPKTESSNRTIPLPDFLTKLVESRRRGDEDFFLSNDQISKVEPRLLQSKFKKITSACALEGVTFHTLRHTFATRCIECGFDAKTLSEILGHSDVKTTLNLYVHCSLELKRNSMNLLEKLAV